ncbi:winged helix-turn-helix domain-containing protein [Mangrovimonas spongiae]|uniref:Winged helix family transcriptional regulator n=1 Tax=Mangrovimonas spongiae TaxID=2494697 RepID=A0A3R9MR52_9FLAO|nr:winged helix-turn-helix domain-containing protein [Mangrovimonas spongiae]RSK38674.1 winged helix family transcriptional regulator [Mangrovimonas spongiae]
MLLFTLLMKIIRYYILTLCVAYVQFACSQNAQQLNTKEVKVALRTVGHKLLLAQQDSTSLVLPVKKINDTNYKLKFENPLSIAPNTLVSIIEHTFKKAKLPQHYIVEIAQCANGEIAYSYQMKREKDTDIIPCGSRVLPKSCYVLFVKFKKDEKSYYLWIWTISLLVLGLFAFFIWKRKQILDNNSNSSLQVSLGSFTFYPEQHKLVKQAEEIRLSKKECEILEILTEKPNEVISREELSKRIWEDNGVVVGRSLDTYISKLRKKLKEDPKIQLTNVHGVGYKLVID